MGMPIIDVESNEQNAWVQEWLEKWNERFPSGQEDHTKVEGTIEQIQETYGVGGWPD